MARAMISLEEAQSRLLTLVKPLPVVTLPLIDAAGSWAAEDVVSKRTQPVRALSAMDGYAVAAGGNSPWRVIGESAAGRPFAGKVGTGEAARIFTGAALPGGTDTVIIQEDVRRNGDAISIEPEDAPRPNQHVRAEGSDFRAGDLLVKAGERLNPARIALIAGGGHGSVAVHRRPRIALLATGDELVPPGEDAGSDLLPESNTVMIAAMLRDFPCDISILGIVPDDLDKLIAAIGSVEADLLVTLGGASVGDHDLVKPALERCGASLDFWKVAMRPGKPVMAGKLGDMLVIGLPGNPVSAFVTTLLFTKPAAAALAGASDPLPRRKPMRLGAALPANGSRADHPRAKATIEGVMPVGSNDSAAMGGLAKADLLIIRAPNAPPAAIGAEVMTLSIL
jgi:molybdopterin molybdotransferase